MIILNDVIIEVNVTGQNYIQGPVVRRPISA